MQQRKICVYSTSYEVENTDACIYVIYVCMHVCVRKGVTAAGINYLVNDPRQTTTVIIIMLLLDSHSTTPHQDATRLLSTSATTTNHHPSPQHAFFFSLVPSSRFDMIPPIHVLLQTAVYQRHDLRETLPVILRAHNTSRHSPPVAFSLLPTTSEPTPPHPFSLLFPPATPLR